MLKRIMACLILFVTVLGSCTVSAFGEVEYVPYKTYTYPAIYAYSAETPDLYVPENAITGDYIGIGNFLEPSDIFVDKDNNVYVIDTGNNRVVVLDKNWSYKFEIKNFTIDGVSDGLKKPMGGCVNDLGHILVADTENNRILEFDDKGDFVRNLGAPITSLLPENFVYKPTAVAVDKAGRVYVIAVGVNMGIIQLSGEGNFEGFIGAQKVQYDVLDYAWKRFMTKEQRERMDSFVPTEYNNVVLDESGFLYVTSSAIDMYALITEIMKPSKEPAASPLKRLNPSGNDVLRRSLKIAVLGDMNFYTYGVNRTGPSVISDVALGESDTYTLLDSNRDRFFMYTKDGEIIGVFGQYGNQIGNTETATAIAYKGTDFLALDKKNGNINVYKQTEYCAQIMEALDLYNHYKYDASVEKWNEIIKKNGGLDLAYLNIGKSYMREENYQEAMKYFKASLEEDEYSKAYKEFRNDWIEKNIIIALILLAGLIFGLVKLFGWINKVNTHEKYKGKRQRIFNQVLYGFYVMFHPFDGFWDLKYEKRGSLAAANIIVALSGLAVLINSMYTAFIYAPFGYYFETKVFYELVQIVIPLLLWVISNWCFTTLMDGKGNFRDIYITTAYALLPFAVMTIIKVALTHVITLDESALIGLIVTIASVWTGGLIFFGNIVVHQYTFFKGVVASVLTIVGIGVILFIVFVFGSTLEEMFRLFRDIYREIMLRF